MAKSMVCVTEKTPDIGVTSVIMQNGAVPIDASTAVLVKMHAIHPRSTKASNLRGDIPYATGKAMLVRQEPGLVVNN